MTTLWYHIGKTVKKSEKKCNIFVTIILFEPVLEQIGK